MNHIFYILACLGTIAVFMIEGGPKTVPNTSCFVMGLIFFTFAELLSWLLG